MDDDIKVLREAPIDPYASEEISFALERVLDRLEAAEAKAEKLGTLMRKMQDDAGNYLMPDRGEGFCAAWFISRTLYHLDGPEQRAAMQAKEPT